MTLEDFEKELARNREGEAKEREDGRTPKHRRHKHHHHKHPDRSRSRDHETKYEDEGHRSKRSRRSHEEEDRSRRHRHHSHRAPEDHKESTGGTSDKQEPELTERLSAASGEELKRDAWMEAPAALDIDYVQRSQRRSPPGKTASLEANYELKVHKNELNHHLRDLRPESDVDGLQNQPVKHEVDYAFGDAGSSWRMTKLKAVYREAKQSACPVEAVAVERYGSLRDFDDAREEELELDRRERYGEGYIGKQKPSGELFQERKIDADASQRERLTVRDDDPGDVVEGVIAPTRQPTQGPVMDSSQLNRLKAQLLRAQMMKDPKADQLEQAYNEALSTAASRPANTVTISAMDSRMLAAGPRNEVKAVSGRRAQERGTVEENEDMSVEDMLREERRDRGQAGGEGQRLAERIAKDVKFDNDLDYMDENATKLAKRVHKSEINLRTTAVNDYQKLSKILDNCPLCYREDTDQPPAAPVISLGTRTYLTLPTEPELSSYAATIVPLQHRTNLLECDDDEWEEIRNFMKSLTRLYHDQGRDVVFYENAAFPNRKPHAALNAVPLPYSLGETAPAFFKEAFLTSEEEWSQHKKIIDTLARSKSGLGKLAFRRSLVKEMPYIHVWFELDGGIGHVVEDPLAWPKGDLFAREIIGGMLDLEPDVIRRQGRWQRGHDSRAEGFKNKWRKFDWTRVLTEG